MVSILALASGVVLAGCQPRNEVIILTQPPKAVTLKPLDLNPQGGIGDTTGFEAPVQNNGKPYGHVMGMMTRVGDLKRGSRPDREERMLTAVFDLPSGQISVLGISYYTQDAILLQKRVPMTRSIVGGTGRYVGVDGEVTTTHNADDSYTHVIRILR